MVAVVGKGPCEDAFELSFRRPPLTEQSGQPLLLALGDPVAGPLMGLFYDRPSTPEELAGPPDLTPAHSHSCDSFRLCLKGELIVGPERYHPGEFRFQESGRPYGRDGDAPHIEGNWRTIMFADRRGHLVRPTSAELRAQYGAAKPGIIERYGDVLPELLDDDDPGVVGMTTNLGPPSRVGHIDGSFDDAARWQSLDDGTQVAAGLLGLPELGPVVLLLRSPAGSVALPAGAFPSDVVHLVAGGSAQLADGSSRMTGDVRVRAAGVAWDEVVAGPGGLDHLLVVGDRRGAFTPDGPTPWHRQIHDVLAALGPARV